MIQNNVRGVANYKSVAKEILKPPYFGSSTPVGIEVYQFCLIYNYVSLAAVKAPDFGIAISLCKLVLHLSLMCL